MSPELVITQMVGVHNEDLDASRSMVMKGGSWKRQRIIVIIPADTLIPAKCALSQWNLIFPPNNGVLRILAQGMEVGAAYSTAISQVLIHPELKDWEYVLCMEHDNCPPQDGLIKLVAQMEQHPELSGIGGLYWTKGEGGCPQIWGDPKDPLLNFRPQPPVPGKLIECCGLGQGFTLFRLAMFKDERLRRPWFVTQKGAEGCSTQDLYFASDARKYGYRFAVDCDCRVGHLDIGTGIIW